MKYEMISSMWYPLLGENSCIPYSSLGIHKVLVALMAQKAEVVFDPAYIMPSQIANHIVYIGFEAVVMENDAGGEKTVELQVRQSDGIVYLLRHM